VIEGEFEDAKGTEAVRSSHDDFGFVVEALDDTAGKLLARLEIVARQKNSWVSLGSGSLPSE
jgi:hypothetical protein